MLPLHRFVEHLVLLSLNPFIRRCSHEFQLAHNSLFLVPTESGVVQLNIAALANWWMATDWRTSPVKNWTDIPHRAFPTLYRAGYYRYFTQYRRTPMAQFYSIFDLKATVETDKIGIGANLAGIQLYFTGPEKSVYECRWILAVLALSAGDVAVLCGTGEKLQLSTEESTPSWLRWNENDEDLVASLSAPTLQGLSHIACINPSLIILDLLAIKRCSLHAPSTESIQRATNFIDRTIPQAWTRFKEGGADLSTPEFQEARRKGIEALACSLDCGLVWMMENMIFNPDLVREVQWKMDLHKIDFWPLITELLMEAYPREQSTISNLTKEQKVSLSLFIYYMFRDIIMCHSSSMYNSGLFTVSATLHCYWLDFGTVHGKALTFLNSDNVPECHFALPAVLSGPTCATLARLWLLRPHSTTANDEWRIIEKIPLVTFRPIEADGEAIILRHDQTIRG